MKNRMFVGLVAAATALVISSSLATAQEAYSANAVGVMKKALPYNKQVLVSIPLDQESDEGDGVQFGDIAPLVNLTNGTKVAFWDISELRWKWQTKTAKGSNGGWGNIVTNRIYPGDAFFIKNEADAKQDAELVISGDVPSDPSISKGLAKSTMALVANPYPVSMAFSELSLVTNLPVDSQVQFWNVDEQRWKSYTKTQKGSNGGWGVAETQMVAVGEGFFIKPADSNVWVQTRPYTWPE